MTHGMGKVPGLSISTMKVGLRERNAKNIDATNVLTRDCWTALFKSVARRDEGVEVF